MYCLFWDYTTEKLTSKADFLKISKPVAIGLMIAIGAAVGLGSIAFSTFLIVGFTLQNTTEGLAIAAPLSRGKPQIAKLFGLVIIAGAPAIFGAWVGGLHFRLWHQ